MANYSLVSNARFRPFSYDELVKPLIQYREAYQQAENDYTNLALQTEAWKNIANQETSPIAYNMYKNYSDELNRTIDDFSNGMSLTNRGKLMKLKRRYASEILPIAKASEELNKAEAFRLETLAKNPNAVFKVDHFNSIDSFLGGQKADNTYWDGSAAMKRTAAKAEALGRSLFSNPTAKVVLNGQQYQISQLNGFTPEMLTEVLLSPENINTEAGKQLRKIITDELDSINLNDYSPEGQSRINNIIATGMYAGLAKPTYNYVSNGEYMSRAERDASAARWRNIALSEKRLALAEKQDKIAAGQAPYYVDNNGTSYYRYGSHYWTTDKDGNTLTTPQKAKTETNRSTREKLASGRSETAKSLNYFYKDFGSNGKSSNFDTTKPYSIVEATSLDTKVREQIAKTLQDSDLSFADVDIYKTDDKDRYRIVKKGYNINGEEDTSVPTMIDRDARVISKGL